MKSRLVYGLAIAGVLATGFFFSYLNTDTKPIRIHQHQEEAWNRIESEEYDPDSTKLPIIMIDTKGQKIPGSVISESNGEYLYETADNGEDTISITISCVDGKKGENTIVDKPDVVSSARIRYRGNSSRHFDKKSYSVKLTTKDDRENPLELAGMPAHNEWVLNGPYLDRTLIRNYLCLNVSGEIMDYAPDVRYCELYVDGKYQGLYLLMESVSRGESRIDFAKSEKNKDMTSYIVRWDREGKGDTELDNFSHYIKKTEVSALDVRYPGTSLITEGKISYIENNISEIEKILYSYDLLETDWTELIDIESFAEYFIINEFFRNIDAGRFSTFYYKDVRDKMKICVWDFNNACNNYISYVQDEKGFSLLNAPWFSQMLKDERFTGEIIKRYRELRENELSEEYLISYIDDTVVWLDEEIKYNYEVWGTVFVLDEYTGQKDFNFLLPLERNYTSYEEAVVQLKEFIINRGNWLDNNIETLYQYSHASRNVNELTR